jgi:predicted RNA-binding Zn-ribbon protein involved in translation (DUF1610 family)
MPRARRTQSKPKPTAKRVKPARSSTFKCPECGKTFARAAALGAHRSRVHGVPGATRSRAAQSNGSRRAAHAAASRTRSTAASSRSRARSTNQKSTGINRDTLLQTLFPNGLPAREAVIREANSWLDQAERLARMK